MSTKHRFIIDDATRHSIIMVRRVLFIIKKLMSSIFSL